VQPRAIVVDGQVVARPVLIVGTTFDHRLLDGAAASRLAKVVCDVIAHPEANLGTPADGGELAAGPALAAEGKQ
jgi:pyruvate/2-oxoglutarate dehydrogenase complex dihydrolipoamide acyltransferase (E2) component